MNLSRAAAVAFLIYVPFSFDQIPLFRTLGDWLISQVVGQIVWLLDLLHYPTTLDSWNIIMRNGFRVEIILACTGIQSIAIMLGIAAAVPTTFRQKVYAFLIVAPTIYFLNLLRNVFVIIAYSDQWFPYYPQIASNGEFGLREFLLGAQRHRGTDSHSLSSSSSRMACSRSSPGSATFADELYQLYFGEIRKAFSREK